MQNLLDDELRGTLCGRVCLVGLGNPDLSDDGFGLRLAAALRAIGYPHVVEAGTTPERWVGRLADAHYDTVLFLDAVELGAEPGAVALFPAEALSARFPQISTHKLSLSLLASLMEASGHTRVWLLGAQPASLRPGGDLTPPLQRTLEALTELLDNALAGQAIRPAGAGERP